MGAPVGITGCRKWRFWEILGLVEKIGNAGKNWLNWKILEKPAVSPKGGRSNYEHFNSQM